jgi:hypothetical protein
MQRKEDIDLCPGIDSNIFLFFQTSGFKSLSGDFEGRTCVRMKPTQKKTQSRDKIDS